MYQHIFTGNKHYNNAICQFNKSSGFPYMINSNKFLKMRSFQTVPILVWKKGDLHYVPLLGHYKVKVCISKMFQKWTTNYLQNCPNIS